MKYPHLHDQTIEYNVLHALEVGFSSKHSIERYLRKINVAVYPRQISDALQRLRRADLAMHKPEHRDRWMLTPNAQVQTGPAGFMAGIEPGTES